MSWIPPQFLCLLTPTRVFHSIFSGYSLTHFSIWIILESVEIIKNTYLCFDQLFSCSYHHPFQSLLKNFFCVCILAVPGLSCSMKSLSCGMQALVPWPEIKPRSPALGVWSLSHWTTSESFHLFLINISSLLLSLYCPIFHCLLLYPMSLFF